MRFSDTGRGLGHRTTGCDGQRLLLGLSGDTDTRRLPGVEMAAEQVSIAAGLQRYRVAFALANKASTRHTKYCPLSPWLCFVIVFSLVSWHFFELLVLTRILFGYFWPCPPLGDEGDVSVPPPLKMQCRLKKIKLHWTVLHMNVKHIFPHSSESYGSRHRSR